MRKSVKIFCVALALLSLSLTLFACDKAGKYNTDSTGKGENIGMLWVEKEIDSMSADDFEAAEGESDYVLMKVKNYGDIVLVLREDVAPITVKNFKKLTSEGFYNGTIFHRVIEEFMIQGGGYTMSGETQVQKDAVNIKGEFTANKVVNNLQHIRGVISMARIGGMNDSASSQFFIMHKTSANSSSSLDGQYATFGYVLAGMDVVDAIACCEVSGNANSLELSEPVEPIVIESVTFVQPKE